MIKINDEIKAFGGWSTTDAVAKVSSYTYNKGVEVRYNTMATPPTGGNSEPVTIENEKTTIKIQLQVFKSIEDYNAGEGSFSPKDYSFLPLNFEMILNNDFVLNIDNVEVKVVEHLTQLGRNVEVIGEEVIDEE
ncbi:MULTISPECIES: hypothetical protein [Sphingobacterium]|uniref:hypothetical protein n=1 Tax=Sphingobacterium TaxID=28453 RepID=UPI0013DC30BD|nr:MULTISPECIES: hypothetical protein [unclassified Sphingobacterium]